MREDANNNESIRDFENWVKDEVYGAERRLEPHPFAPYAEANHICKRCDGGEYAACHATPRRHNQ